MTTRLINGLFGAIVAFDDVVHSDTNIESHFVGKITQKMYQDIVESINNPNCLAFWNPDNTLKIRRINVTFGSNTYLDNSRNAIVALDNKLTLIPACIDQNGTVWNDVTEVDIKNMEKKAFDISINGQDGAQYKAVSTNNQPVIFKLNDQGRATLRFKMKVPEVDGLWLSVYPEVYAYDSQGLAKLAAWASTNN